MDGTIIATGLAFPEGPVWLDGDVLLTEIAGGTIARWSPASGLTRIAAVGGGPNGATLGADGALYVTQNGGMFSDDADRVTAGILRVDPDDGSWAVMATEVDGLTLEGPNDLAFGPDGRLYFTDPRGAADPALNGRPGRLFAVELASGGRVTDGELLREVGPVFPNGIAFDADGTLLWTESFSRRVMRLVDGRAEVVIGLPERHAPDGMCVGADGTLYVASTYAHCVSVVRDGAIVERLMCGDGMVTNCCFGATDLYVTESRRGTLYRFPLGVEGLPLH
ncbi:MAG: SMP-30/gluconolactonase/LRE family protein [Acidimicrobiia bacterium]|nr:SMP-30/gluconolactonase/LRE family protein [Acidimicrobiia bacterium]